jgi:class 3 adenylate cyclase
MATKTYGTVSAEQQKSMSGLFVKGLATGVLPLNTFAKTLGYDVAEAESGRVAITLDPTGAHLNPWGTVPERRYLTVMFCDLVGSTSISAQLDAEDWRELV